MSTRSNIAIKNQDGSVEVVYCHFDGYPTGVGQVLLNWHNSEEAARAIIALGDLSALYKSIEQPEGHSFENRVEGYSVFYGRDRGETGTEARKFDSVNEWIKDGKEGWAEYFYIWMDGRWQVSTGDFIFQAVNKAIEKDLQLRKVM